MYFSKETTLSSIHAQICGCQVIMENHKSNRERVINNENLFEIDNLEQASQILKKIIDNNEYKNRMEYIPFLKDREYNNQVKKLRNLIKKSMNKC